MSSFSVFRCLLLVSLIINVALSEYEVISEICPDASFRNPYDPRMAFNKYLGNIEYPLHPRSENISHRFISNINQDKIGWSRKVPIYVIDDTTTWDIYDVIYRPFGESNVWTTFRCPPPELIGNEIGKYKWDGSEDWPFIIFDPNHPIHGRYTELRGFHTYIDHTAKIIYCEGCGLFKYNNDGRILNPDNITISDGVDFLGQGTGSGLSWPGAIRRDDVLSGVIAHAIRMAFSSCDFFADIYVVPAVKTDQPKGVSSSSVPDGDKIAMGYRFRLSVDTNCDNRLAPMYENNATWYPPTQQHTDFVRMFCIAMREYGSIPSDGSGSCGGSQFQGENDITANWTQVFGSGIDDSTQSWSYLIRDYTTPNDNRYRDERHGVPWWNIQVLNDSTDGEINNCCLDSNQCTTTPSPTYIPYVDDTPGPQCLNENCCYKHRFINERLRINDDNCIIYNCTFNNIISGADIISVYTKKNGNPALNTLIDSNMFYVGNNMDAIDIKNGENTKIYNNWFSDTISSDYRAVRLSKSLNASIKNNVFTGSVDTTAISFEGLALNDIIDTYIEGNTFDNVDYGIVIDFCTNTNVLNNIFRNITSDGIRHKYYGSATDQSNGVLIDGNTFITLKRGIYIGYDIGNVVITNNIIKHTTNSHGIELSGITNNCIISNNVILNLKAMGILMGDGHINTQILNNDIGDTGDHGLRIYGDNFLIKNNIIHDVDPGGSGRAIYTHSYGTIDGNLIYNSSRRGISISGDDASLPFHELIIENNMIHSIKEDPILLYPGSYSPKHTKIRFNTVISSNNYYALNMQSGFQGDHIDIYCNIFISIDTNKYYQDRSPLSREYNNYKSLLNDISSIKFIDDVNYNNLHLQTTSPAIAYCNNLNITKFPLPLNDYDQQRRRSDQDIDVGADQRSPIVPTLSPTLNPSKSPTDNTDGPTNNPTHISSETTTSETTASETSTSETSTSETTTSETSTSETSASGTSTSDTGSGSTSATQSSGTEEAQSTTTQNVLTDVATTNNRIINIVVIFTVYTLYL